MRLSEQESVVVVMVFVGRYWVQYLQPYCQYP